MTVYSNTPTIITAYISLVAKLSILPFIFIIIHNCCELDIVYNFIYVLIAFSILLSMFIGGVGVLSQIKMKILL
ncbi:hypothetical protein HGI15_21740, partial [Modestobacter lapidis]|nr:hypothetical protein [Modestobacter lapidis]